jgi:magnesium chelatase subunit I
MTGKIDLEYEGELKGADKVAQELIRSSVGEVFSRYFNVAEFQQIVNWFDLGGTLKLSDMTSAEESFRQLRVIQGLVEKTATLGTKKKEELPLLVSACEFILDGLYALRKISRSEEKGYFASEKKRSEAFFDDQPGRARKSYN